MNSILNIISRVFLALFLIPSTSLWAFDTETLWRRALGGKINTYPAQGPGGDLYVVADDRALHSLNPLTGESHWIYRPGGRLKDILLVAPDGTVYVQNDRGELYAVSPGGVGRWVLRLNAELASIPVVSPDGRLIVPLIGGRIISISRLGTILWERDENIDISTAPLIDTRGRIWLPLVDGRIVGLNTWGERIAVLRGVGQVSEMALDSAGNLWTGGFSGALAMFMLSRIDNVRSLVNLSPEFRTNLVRSSVTVILTSLDSVATVFYSDGNIVRIDSRGNELSRQHFGSGLSSPVISKSGNLFFSASDGNLRVIEPSGEQFILKGRSQLGEPLLSLEGILVAGGDDWILYAWKAEEPAEGWSQYRGGARRSGSFPANPVSISRREARKDTGFLFREQMALSNNVSDRLELIRELEAFESQAKMYRELPWANLLLEDLMYVGTLRQVDNMNKPMVSHAIARERAYALLGRSEDFRKRDILNRCLRLETDLRAMGAGFLALGQLGSDWDGKSLRLITSVYRNARKPDDQLTLSTAKALAALIRYNGEITDQSGYDLIDSLLRDAEGRPVYDEVLATLREISGVIYL